MGIQLRRTLLAAETPFAFSCSQCSSCCRDKKIQVNPYEIARLARNRNMSTSSFAEHYTDGPGTLLNWREDGTCVFLEPGGCSVHPDRPLVCRLYPLGRHVLNSGAEHFSEIEPDPECTGVYLENGTITDYLESQGARPFMHAADRYLNLFWKLHGILLETAADPAKEEAIITVFRNFSLGAGEKGEKAVNLTDMDAAVAEFCNRSNRQVPIDVEEKMSIHIEAVEAWANNARRTP
jgi:uncharacterized protein